MCDRPHYEDLDERLTNAEMRLTAVETTVTDMRAECKQGFADVKSQLDAIYSERAAWGKWARENIGHALRWAGVIILTACGITQASSIIQELAKAFGRG